MKSRVRNVSVLSMLCDSVLITCLSDTISAAVTDGVTVGHPCCAEHECKKPLSNVHNEYCREHLSRNLICCIGSCNSRRTEGFKTCSEPEHRAQENLRKERSRRVKKSSRPRTDEGDDEEVSKGRRQRLLPGTFNRKWTHNEQLMVRPCGVIIGRATFYNFESMGAVKVYLVLIPAHHVSLSTTGVHT